MIHPFDLTGFSLADGPQHSQQYARQPPRARSISERDGFFPGEGAGAVVLESLGHARARGGARIYGEICGYGSTSDAYRITAFHPEGRGASPQHEAPGRSRRAINPEEIDYISAHGTSTPTKRSTGNARDQSYLRRQRRSAFPTSSHQSMTGQLITATGVIELIVRCSPIRDGVVPPTINLETPDPECDLGLCTQSGP